MRFGAIDIGSNSIRSLVVDVPDAGRHRVIDDERAQTRLGSGIAATGMLANDAMALSVEALVRMVDIARSRGAEQLRIVATAAVRDASNGLDFALRVAQATGEPVEIISAEDEARLAFLSAGAHFALEGPCAVFDIGGGSLEVVLSNGESPERVFSLPLGAVRLSEAFLGRDPITPKDHEQLRNHVRSSLAEALGAHVGAVGMLVGSGGTVTTLGALSTGGAVGGPGMQGMYVPRERIDSIAKQLRHSSAAERAAMPGMPAHRVDIIAAGALVVREVVRALDAPAVLVNTKGVREGLILDTISRISQPPPRRDRMEHVDDLMDRYRADREHAVRVKAVALGLFDDLGAGLGIDPTARPLLEAAALLHDVGYYIDYHSHHKHSWHLITHADLPGFSARELQLIAAIARYHRGAMPKRGHEALQPLSPEDSECAVQLGALLRLADGIDRSRSQRVRRVDAAIDGDRVLLRLVGGEDLSVEVYGTRQKGDLFTEVFGLPLVVSSVAEASPDDTQAAAMRGQ